MKDDGVFGEGHSGRSFFISILFGLQGAWEFSDWHENVALEDGRRHELFAITLRYRLP